MNASEDGFVGRGIMKFYTFNSTSRQLCSEEVLKMSLGRIYRDINDEEGTGGVWVRLSGIMWMNIEIMCRGLGKGWQRRKLKRENGVA